ncbi:mitogen-activated protein kinase, partial [Tribonema minus]
TGSGAFAVDRKYVNLKVIGDGSYGVVYSAYDTKKKTRVAIKKVTDIFRDLEVAKRVLREMKLLRHFNLHENVVTVLDVTTEPRAAAATFRDVYLVTALMESTLHDVIASSQPLSDKHHQYFLYQLLRGLKYIHSANVVHRDLKPSNLLVNANCDLAICDFGLARGMDLAGGHPLTGYVVTRWYRAPELLSAAPHYGKEVDMWSVGCIFAEMLGRAPCFQGTSPLKCILSKLGAPPDEDLGFMRCSPARDIVLALVRAQRALPPAPRLSCHLPSDAVDLLHRMLQFNPARRISVCDALEHPYLKDLHSHMLHAEPVCDAVFDCAFKNKYFGPDGCDVPLHELRMEMWR